MINYRKYLDEKVHQLRVVSRSQWDYLNYSKLCNWLEDNFHGDDEGKYFIVKILLHTIYYRKVDIEKLIEFGLFEKIYGTLVKDQLIQENNVFIDNSTALAKINNLKDKSFFIPLLDSNKPYESGNIFIGELVHKLGIKAEKVNFHWNVTAEHLLGNDLLIFVDDCIGSGSQLKKFWNSPEIQSLRKITDNLGIKVFYLVLIGYNKNIEKLKAENKLLGVEIVVCELLTDNNRIFSEENIIWDKETNEREKAINYFESLKQTKGINFLGYKSLDFAVILSDRVPNWTLPLFWKEMVNWKYLLRRKTSSI